MSGQGGGAAGIRGDPAGAADEDLFGTSDPVRLADQEETGESTEQGDGSSRVEDEFVCRNIAEAALKMTAPMMKIFRSPKMSPSRPPSTMKASGSMFAVRIHWPALASPSRSDIASGIARGTEV